MRGRRIAVERAAGLRDTLLQLAASIAKRTAHCAAAERVTGLSSNARSNSSFAIARVARTTYRACQGCRPAADVGSISIDRVAAAIACDFRRSPTRIR